MSIGINPLTLDQDIEFLHQVGRQMASSDSLSDVLGQIVDFATGLIKCDSCFVYVLEEQQLVLRASKNPHPGEIGRVKLDLGEGVTGWVAEHREAVAVSQNATQDARFKPLSELPEDQFEALLSVPILSRARVVGVINLQHRQQHTYTKRQIRLISTIGFLAGAAIEMARLEEENTNLARQLETRKLLERAKGILQRDLGLTEEQAYLTLQRQSRQKRKPLKEIAEAVVLGEEIKRGTTTN